MTYRLLLDLLFVEHCSQIREVDQPQPFEFDDENRDFAQSRTALGVVIGHHAFDLEPLFATPGQPAHDIGAPGDRGNVVVVEVVVADERVGGAALGQLVAHLGSVGVDDDLVVLAGDGKPAVAEVFDKYLRPFEAERLTPATVYFASASIASTDLLKNAQAAVGATRPSRFSILLKPGPIS